MAFLRSSAQSKRSASVRRLCLVIALALAACSRPLDFRTEAATVGDIRDVVPAVGRVRTEVAVDVRALRGGRIAGVSVRSGELVRKGQPLARLEAEDADATLREAGAELRAARAAASQALVRAQEARRLYDSRKTLVDRGFYSEDGLRTVASQLSDAEAGLAAATAVIDAASARVERAESAVRGQVIASPINGVVLAVNAEPGETVGPSDEDPLFVLVGEDSTMIIEAEVAEPDIARIYPDMAVRFTVDAFPAKRFTGRIRQILRNPKINGAFVSYGVLVEVENEERALMPGMTAAVEFVNTEVRQVLRVPVQALYYVPRDYTYDPPERYRARVLATQITEREQLAALEMGILFANSKNRLFVERNGRWERREVKIGRQSRDYVEITEGVRPGERVILSEAGAS